MTAEPAQDAAPVVRERQIRFVPALDGVRGIAVLLVVSVHFRRLLDPWTTEWIYTPRLARALAGNTTPSDGWILAAKAHPSFLAQLLVPKGGILGVDIFFVLSGFLITTLLLREQSASGRVGFGAFYRRRALRLMPALFVFLAAQIVYANALHVRTAVERSSVIAVIFYYLNWKLFFTFPEVGPALGHLWSLSIEEQFYWIWPLATLVLLGVRRRLSTVLVALVGCILAIAIWRALLIHHFDPVRVYFRTDARADSLLVGALAAHLWVRRIVPPRRLLVPAAWVALGFVIFCVAHSSDWFLFNGGFTLIALAVAIMLLAVVDTTWWPTRALTIRPLRAVGRVSYGLYLWHVLVFSAVGHYMRTSPAGLRVVTGLALTAAVTVASWQFVEKPFLRWKRRLEAPTEVPTG